MLAKFEAEFEPVANAIENGEFALWVGSGISRQAPSLGGLIERAFDHIRQRVIDPATSADFLPALHRILVLAEIDPASVQHQYDQPLANWPEHGTVIDRLWNKYSRVLDARVTGKAADYVLWEAVDIRSAFENPAPPAAEHLCIAILILEGAVQTVASANWDGFIEAAVARLSNGVPGILQVVVDPAQLRSAPGRARLLKFHGCIVHATNEPDVFRRHLIGSHPQILRWPVGNEFAAMRNQIVGLATNSKTLVMGLSIQDMNLQTVFASAAEVNAWPWPCTPHAMAQVFCEEEIQQGQRDVLTLVYGDSYNDNIAAVDDASLLRAWGEKVLIALVLKLLTDKLARLMNLGLAPAGKGAIAAALAPALTLLRDDVGALALPAPGERNRTAFVNQAIALWSRTLSLFRSGVLPDNVEGYEALCSSTPQLMAADANALGSGLAKLGVALALLQNGRVAGQWDLRPPLTGALTAGAMTARALRPDGVDRPLFLVKSATEAIALKAQGAFANDNAIIIHGDDVWHQLTGGGSSARRVRAAPGRTGNVGETHVSLGTLLNKCADEADLQRTFMTEMML
ncbi:MAG: hypothetical protein DI605_19355 [Sphingomonas sp.]|nr:MAG: hypothetical protein DI605_19355 [Sphingomonas sp.]